jgi:hypothetical protein
VPLEGSSVQESIPLRGPKFLIGRGPQCDFSFRKMAGAQRISSEHLEIERDAEGRVLVQNYGRHGSVVGGKPLKAGERIEAKAGDEIVLTTKPALVGFRLSLGSSPQPHQGAASPERPVSPLPSSQPQRAHESPKTPDKSVTEVVVEPLAEQPSIVDLVDKESSSQPPPPVPPPPQQQTLSSPAKPPASAAASATSPATVRSARQLRLAPERRSQAAESATELLLPVWKFAPDDAGSDADSAVKQAAAECAATVRRLSRADIFVDVRNASRALPGLRKHWPSGIDRERLPFFFALLLGALVKRRSRADVLSDLRPANVDALKSQVEKHYAEAVRAVHCFTSRHNLPGHCPFNRVDILARQECGSAAAAGGPVSAAPSAGSKFAPLALQMAPQLMQQSSATNLRVLRGPNGRKLLFAQAEPSGALSDSVSGVFRDFLEGGFDGGFFAVYAEDADALFVLELASASQSLLGGLDEEEAEVVVLEDSVDAQRGAADTKEKERSAASKPAASAFSSSLLGAARPRKRSDERGRREVPIEYPDSPPQLRIDSMLSGRVAKAPQVARPPAPAAKAAARDKLADMGFSESIIDKAIKRLGEEGDINQLAMMCSTIAEGEAPMPSDSPSDDGSQRSGAAIVFSEAESPNSPRAVEAGKRSRVVVSNGGGAKRARTEAAIVLGSPSEMTARVFHADHPRGATALIASAPESRRAQMRRRSRSADPESDASDEEPKGNVAHQGDDHFFIP